jgi:hypothetical protein
VKFVKLFRLKKPLIAATFIWAAIMAALIIYFAIPLPTPKISIEFQSFKSDKIQVFQLVADTNSDNQLVYKSDSKTNWWFTAFPSSRRFPLAESNVCCSVYLTNHGPTRIWWISLDCHVEARTSNGWITNCFGHFTTVPNSVGPFQRDDFWVYIPADAVEWRVTGKFDYYKRHNALQDYVGWLMDDLKFGHKGSHPPEIVIYPLYGFSWVLSLLPEPDGQSGEIQSNFFTNRPPIAITAASTSIK